jgi:hypothetical protein
LVRSWGCEGRGVGDFGQDGEDGVVVLLGWVRVRMWRVEERVCDYPARGEREGEVSFGEGVPELLIIDGFF